jgi:hypothetical protein
MFSHGFRAGIRQLLSKGRVLPRHRPAMRLCRDNLMILPAADIKTGLILGALWGSKGFETNRM